MKRRRPACLRIMLELDADIKAARYARTKSWKHWYEMQAARTKALAAV